MRLVLESLIIGYVGLSVLAGVLLGGAFALERSDVARSVETSR